MGINRVNCVQLIKFMIDPIIIAVIMRPINFKNPRMEHDD
mgnify:CR=1 FL=1